ncbi:MAG: SDR family oxidoreductase [Alphaproteobacteria bacterium]
MTKPRNIVISGIAGGIGSTIARAIGEHGDVVFGIDCKPYDADIIEGYFYLADIRADEDIAKVANQIEEEFGPVDVLINSAAVLRTSPAETMRSSDWREVVDVNLTGTFILCREFGKFMLRRHRGKIINIASRCGKIGYPYTAAYNASKAGIISLTKTLAVEWSGRGVNVNSIIPGFVLTDMSTREAGDECISASLIRNIPAGKASVPSDLVGAVQFLASEEANYVNGIELVVDGGTIAASGTAALLVENQ